MTPKTSSIKFSSQDIIDLPPTQLYLSLEELKMYHWSCWLCGCNWQEDHISLDCPECGGYALTRPCPNCSGKCNQIWQRNIIATHDHHKALWFGQCTLNNPQSAHHNVASWLPNQCQEKN